MGKILSSELSISDINTENLNKTYNAIIKYQYQIDGVIYLSNKIYYGDWIFINNSSYMRKIIKQFSVGKECIVYYNAQKPQKSVLMVGLALPVWFLLIGGIICTGIGIYMYALFDLVDFLNLHFAQ